LQELSNPVLFGHYTEMRFAFFLSVGFATMTVINPPERKLAKHTSVHCVNATLKRLKYLIHVFASNFNLNIV
jgi:hypothetical protein